MSDTAQRLQHYIKHFAALYPSAWHDAERFYRNRAQMGNWPDWCFVPMAGAIATVMSTAQRAPFRIPPAVIAYGTAVLGALIPWRLGQGVYRFDADLLADLWETPVDGDIPGEILFRLPEYAVYVEAPKGVLFEGSTLYGFFAHLEWDVNTRHAELRLLLDTGNPDAMTPLPIHLGGTLEEGFRAMLRHTTTLDLRALDAQVPDLSRSEIDTAAIKLAQIAQPAVSCLLYLCSEAVEYSGPQQPVRVSGKKMFLPSPKPQVWDVGVRMGAALRRARSAQEDGGTQGGTGGERSVRGHVRRAHWHTFLTGPRSAPQKRVLRWLPPIAVNLDTDDDRPVVVHKISDVDE